MSRTAITYLGLVLFLSGPGTAATGGRCPPAGYDRKQLQALQAADFAIADATGRQLFAISLTACLASPDPYLRDRIAFAALSHMLRAQQLDKVTQSALVDNMLLRLVSKDLQGFERPFAALLLSELVRAERLTPYFAAARLQQIADRSIDYFVGIRDYRGFDENDGWRHGVAHGSDLLLQLTLNPTIGRANLLRIRAAIAGQIAPVGHFYVNGESERLARPILFMARSGVFTAEEWAEWFRQLVPADSNLFVSQRGLALRHNINAFLAAAFVNARLNEDAADDVLLPGLESALKSMP